MESYKKHQCIEKVGYNNKIFFEKYIRSIFQIYIQV